MRMTHYAKIVSSGRYVPVVRLGRLLIVIHRFHGDGSMSGSFCRYDARFKLLPREGGAQ